MASMRLSTALTEDCPQRFTRPIIKMYRSKMLSANLASQRVPHRSLGSRAANYPREFRTSGWGQLHNTEQDSPQALKEIEQSHSPMARTTTAMESATLDFR
jgi:hypothetical protein